MIEASWHLFDASVALKWFLRLDDEPFQEVADEVLRDYSAGAIDLSVLVHTPWEIGHALTRAIRRGRATREQAEGALYVFDTWKIGPVSDLLTSRQLGLEMALDYGCSFYDGTYLATSQFLSAPFIHADEELHRKLAGRFRWELWIEDLPPRPRHVAISGS